MSGPGDLSNLAKAAVDFAIAVFVLALIATFILQALHEFGIRALANRWMVRQRIHLKQSYFRTKSTYNLPYRQLCGQFAAAVNIDLAAGKETKLLHALADSSEIEGVSASDKGNAARLQALGFRAQQGIDGLQEYLGTAWIRINYAIAVIIIAVIVLVLIYTPNAFDPSAKFEELTAARVMLFAVGGVASLVVPLGQRLLERLIVR